MCKAKWFTDPGYSRRLGWMIGPFVTSIPEETLSFTLQGTRKTV